MKNIKMSGWFKALIKMFVLPLNIIRSIQHLPNFRKLLYAFFFFFFLFLPINQCILPEGTSIYDLPFFLQDIMFIFYCIRAIVMFVSIIIGFIMFCSLLIMAYGYEQPDQPAKSEPDKCKIECGNIYEFFFLGWLYRLEDDARPPLHSVLYMAWARFINVLRIFFFPLRFISWLLLKLFGKGQKMPRLNLALSFSK